MYSPPMYTGRRSLEPTFCSKLIEKLRSKSGNKIPKDSNKIDINKSKNYSNNRHEEIDIKLCLRKLQRLTMLLPLVLRRSEAFQEGLQNCKTCTITSGVYKMEMQHSKVIEMLVDGVIEKEQIESMNEDSLISPKEKSISKKTSSQNEGNKISIGFDVYCEMDEIKHNMKCILVMLQRHLGNLLVQICYVKTKKIEKEENNKHFNLSVSDLKIIKYEHSNLTDKIITLLKPPSPIKTNAPRICVACIKEKIIESNLKLSSVLKTARHLNLVMKNANLDETTSACCSRNYPHIHAECQNKPIVLKYTQPFTPANPTKEKSTGFTQPSTSAHSKTSSDSNPEPNIQQPSGQKRKSKEIPTNQTNNKPKRRRDFSQASALQANLQNSIPQVDDLNRPKNPTKKSTNINYKNKTQGLEKGSSKTEIPHKDDSLDSRNVKSSQQIKDEHENEKLMNNLSPSDDSSLAASKHDTNPEDCWLDKEDNDLYCGCNSTKMYKEHGIKVLTKDTIDVNREASTQRSYTGSSSPSYIKEEESEYKKPNVQFQTYLMNLGDPKLNPIENENKANNEFNENGKEDHNLSINVVDSVMLTKQRLSVAEHSTKKDKFVIQNDKSDSSVLKSHSDPSKHNSSMKTKLTDCISKPHSSKIIHQSKKVEEVLNCVGRDNLLQISSPAECCKTNKLLVGYENDIHLPISVSLNSLPLDNEDLNYIANLAEKYLSHNDMLIISDEENTAIEYKCTTEKNKMEQDETKWCKAFSPKESPNINCLSSISSPHKYIIQGKTPSVKGYIIDDDMTLPTITEEEINTEDHIPFMPSIPSLTMDEEDKNYISAKKQCSGINNKSVELRYLTIEFPNILQIKKQKQSIKFDFSKIFSTNDNKAEYKNRDLENKVYLTECAHTCSSSQDNFNLKGLATENIKRSVVESLPEVRDASLKAVEEMIMMYFIYLNSNL